MALAVSVERSTVSAQISAAVTRHTTRAILATAGAVPLAIVAWIIWLATVAFDSILVAIVVVMTVLLPFISAVGTLRIPRRR
jgi:hypothetical protein